MGWLKFTSGPADVLYRGQTKVHSDMSASGLRNQKQKGRDALSAALNVVTNSLFGGGCSCRGGPFSFGSAHLCNERLPTGHGTPLVTGTYRASVEPLLQHYGIVTRWLDVVDNVWVALWFACHDQVGRDGFAYHLRRSVGQEGVDAEAYIAVLSTGEVGQTAIPGYRVGPQTRVVDLRYGVPSVYLRPHAQHGLLVAPAKLPVHSNGSLISQVLAYVRVKLSDALGWLGEGGMTTTHVLFPPAARDDGYKRLLEATAFAGQRVGRITHYGPGM